MDKNDIKNLERIKQAQECIEYGTERDFVRLANTISNDNSVLLPRYFGYTGAFEMAADNALSEFISAFAARYPHSIGKCSYDAFSAQIQSAAIREIIAGSKAAYPLADILLSSAEADNVFSDIIGAAVCCGNDSFFDYYIEHTKAPSACANRSLVNYLLTNKEYRCLDKIFENTSRDDLINLSSQNIPNGTTPRIDFLYELGLRYLPEIKNSDNIPDAASEFLGQAGLSDYLDCSPWTISDINGPYVTVWNFMKEHGLKFRNISALCSSYPMNVKQDRAESEMILQNYLMPLFDDKVYIDVTSASMVKSNDQKEFLNAVKLIGADRIYLDFTDRHAPKSPKLIEQHNTDLHITNLIKADLKVRVDDDIAHSKIFRSILKNSSVLYHVLQKTDIPCEKLGEVIDICIEKKYFDSLNIIRKYMSKQET